jgi:RimJ/RimL family protein N-acetyltransferase
MKPITLIDVYEQHPDNLLVVLFLYELLAERDPVANISHRVMPTFDQHRKFVESRPYQAWYVIQSSGENVGAIYLTQPARPSQAGDEIGIHISKARRGFGYGKQAIRMLMQMHPKDRYLANIAPSNTRSLILFGDLGFELCQHTLELRTK